ncbi:PREDICTED: non-specific lipid-transfer protein-like protein At2g13820 [Nelumbo nucifera]|uniref:Bifunctional inhibitor/plant lipid transfer protein/seed storage helical domain-containing protein n=2 Tax=Nelumbo nucifera TaxID=4432 RepID=A0A822ZSP1_NELNU|nr:PREDICTED: non-specific lipid-transfer protein-like protein At2g13820 [Nelumbo nucifera]DAD47903.1 TPA_asm: hypothetical protein HUJ06_017840 [Nelumbo nucifera]
MALKRVEMGLVMVFIVTMLWVELAVAQLACTSALISMAPCTNFITGNFSTPTVSCCTNFENVVKTQPECLCTVINGTTTPLGFNINQTRAMELPTACNVQTPPVSQCKAANGPATSPAGSPASSPSDLSNKTAETTTPTPSISVFPLGANSSATGFSDGNSNTKSPLQLVIFLLFIASCASNFPSF